MKSLWVQDTAFPIIARAIERSYRDPKKFVSRKEIVQWLTHDAQTWKLIETAYKKIARKKSIEQYTGNMVDWFSQRWTVGDPKWLWLFKKYERSEKKIDGCWAYKPLAESAVIVF